jgi:hypothetical protein
MMQVCSGHGSCLGQVPFCSCFRGYAGTSCGNCAVGYFRGKAGCIMLPSASSSRCNDGIRNGDEEGVDCGGAWCPVACPASTPWKQPSSTASTHKVWFC